LLKEFLVRIILVLLSNLLYYSVLQLIVN